MSSLMVVVCMSSSVGEAELEDAEHAERQVIVVASNVVRV